MDRINISEFMKQEPESKPHQLLPYLDHIVYLRNSGYFFRQLCILFGMKESTFRYNLKKAQQLSRDKPELPTNHKIHSTFSGMQQPDDLSEKSDSKFNVAATSEYDIAKSCKTPSEKIPREGTAERDRDGKSPRNREPTSESKDSDREGEESKAYKSQEEWAEEVMRTAKPSRYAQKFNIELKHQ